MANTVPVLEARMLLAVNDGCTADVRSTIEAAGKEAHRLHFAAEKAFPYVLTRVRKRKRGAEKMLKMMAPHIRRGAMRGFAQRAVRVESPDVLRALRTCTADDEVLAKASAEQVAKSTMNGDAERVALLLTLGASPEAPDEWNYRPLHRALQKGHTAIMRALIDGGADVNQRDPWGYAPLHRVAQNGQMEEARMLVAAGARLEIMDGRTNLYTPLSTACFHGDEDMACFLVQCGAQVTDAILNNWHGSSRAPGTVLAAVMLRDRIPRGCHRACALVSTLHEAHNAVQTIRNGREPDAMCSDGEDYARRHEERRHRAADRRHYEWIRSLYNHDNSDDSWSSGEDW